MCVVTFEIKTTDDLKKKERGVMLQSDGSAHIQGYWFHVTLMITCKHNYGKVSTRQTASKMKEHLVG